LKILSTGVANILGLFGTLLRLPAFLFFGSTISFFGIIVSNEVDCSMVFGIYWVCV
jgi:hypothetical protein